MYERIYIENISNMSNNKKMDNIKQPIRGARDLYPEDLAIRNWLFNKWRKVAKNFGYQEIDGPILESFDLFALKSGEELVNTQMYTLEDRDGKKLGVRPEITPTFSRMVAKKQGELIFPLRWTMFGNAWRYEKPQKGRVRDFWQWELNLVGGNETLADAEVITLAAKAMEAIGLSSKDVVFRINDRRFMQEIYTSIDIDKNIWKLVSDAIDKIERISEDEFDDKLIELGLATKQIDKLNKFLKNPDYKASKNINSLFELLDKNGISEYVTYDPLIVRGLEYYTGTVFECFDKSKEFRSIFGGGRFDDLVETFGGGKVGAVGFAIGDVVVTELLKKLNKLPNLEIVPTSVLVTIFSPELINYSINISNKLRQSGINTELYPENNARLEKQLKYANKKSIPFVIIAGENEKNSNLATIKNMQSGEQETIEIENAIEIIRDKIEPKS